MNTSKINHDIRSNQGRTIYMPEYCEGEEGFGNLAIPNPNVLDSAQKYPHGTAFRAGERTWFYSQYKGTINPNGSKVLTQEAAGYYMYGKGLAGYAYQQDYAASNIYGVEGEDNLYIITAQVSGGGVDERANNVYAGGTWTVYDTTHTYNKAMGGRVIEQAYSATTLVVGGHSITTPSILTLDQDLVANVTWGTAKGTVMPNKWKLAVYGGSQANGRYMPILGASNVGNISTYNQWLWLQTHGEIMIVHVSSDLFGDVEGYVKAVWNSDGSIDPAKYGTAYTRQTAGFVASNSMSETNTATSESYPIVYLTMIP